MTNPHTPPEKNSVFHPFLFALAPLFFLFAHNLSELSLLDWASIPRLLLPSIVLVLCTAGFFTASRIFLKESQKAGFLTTIIVALVFGYGHFYTLLVEQAGIQILFSIRNFSFGYNKLYILIVGLIIPLSVYFLKVSSKRFDALTRFLNIVALVLLVLSLGRIAVYEAQRMRRQYAQNSAVSSSQDPERFERKPMENRPDIYYIILDAYGHQQTLRAEFGYDNSDFYDALRRKGFYVATESRSNYPYTVLSLASSLNFDYLHNLTNIAGTDSTDETVAIDLIENNNILHFLQARGYTYIHFNTEYAPTARNRNADREIDCERGMIQDRFLKMFLRTTIFDPFVRRLSGSKQERIHCQFSALAALPEMEEPTFAFAHIIAPHEPYVFGAGGAAVDEAKQNFFQGVKRFEPEGRELYLQQLLYINTQIQDVIDTILKNSTQEPIIILQADHGPRLPPWDGPQQVWYRILNAYYVPGGVLSQLYSSISPVNSFRVLLNEYFQTSYPLLPDKSYYSDYYQTPYKFVEVMQH